MNKYIIFSSKNKIRICVASVVRSLVLSTIGHVENGILTSGRFLDFQLIFTVSPRERRRLLA